MTRILLYIILLLFYTKQVVSQDIKFPIYRWEEVGGANPDTILGLNFSKEKLDSLPHNLTKFKNLKYLNISRNRFNSLPDFLDSLKNLEYFIATRNDFSIFPLVLTRLTKLKEIIINRNDINHIPGLIQNCVNLEKLDLGDNALTNLPESIFSISKLNKVDLTGIRFGPKYQEYILSKRKDIKWILDSPCDCMER
jgi:Leucine-rich repeat (LRR) protein